MKIKNLKCPVTMFCEPGAQKDTHHFLHISVLSKPPQNQYGTIVFCWVGWAGSNTATQDVPESIHEGTVFRTPFFGKRFSSIVPKALRIFPENLSQGVPERSSRNIYELMSNWILMKRAVDNY